MKFKIQHKMETLQIDRPISEVKAPDTLESTINVSVDSTHASQFR